MAANGFHGIPCVDISAFTSKNSRESQDQTARELARCLRPHGCVGITGHGVPSSLLAEAFSTTKALFDLPLEDKMKAPHPNGVTPHRGYSGTGREKGTGKGATDTDDQLRKEELIKISDYKVCHYMSITYNIPRDKSRAYKPSLGKLRDWERRQC